MSTDGDNVVEWVFRVVQCAKVRRRVASSASFYSHNDYTRKQRCTTKRRGAPPTFLHHKRLHIDKYIVGSVILAGF